MRGWRVHEGTVMERAVFFGGEKMFCAEFGGLVVKLAT